MTELYDITCERLWEKLVFHKERFKGFKLPEYCTFPWDELVKFNPYARELLNEVREEYHYEMSVFQASWAVCQTFWRGVEAMELYNERYGKKLRPRP